MEAPLSSRVPKLVALHAAYTKAAAALAAGIAEAMDDPGIMGDPVRSMRGFLKHEFGMRPQSAAMLVRIAERVDDLPTTFERLRDGTVTIDHVDVIAKHTRKADEQDVSASATQLTAVELQRLARDLEPPRDDEVADQQDTAHASYWSDELTGWWHFNAKLAIGDGVMVERALGRILDQQWLARTNDTIYPERVAEAFIEMAGMRIDTDPDRDRATIVLHVTDPGSIKQVAMAEHGPVIGGSQLERYACSARKMQITHDRYGAVIGIGRTSRVVPQWLKRAVFARDNGCRFHGCQSTFALHIHHIVHWLCGGDTDLDNLITLCGTHHRKLHDEQWTIEDDSSHPSGIRFRNRWGIAYEPARSQEESKRIDQAIAAINRERQLANAPP